MISLNSLKNRRIFITGHTGFSGSWLAIWLNAIGAKVYGFSLPPPTVQNNYDQSKVKAFLTKEWIADICDRETLSNALKESRPELIIHLAAQAIVSEGYENPIQTLQSNVIGTACLLDCVRTVSQQCAIIAITSDKCYHNNESLNGLLETDRMGGKDPYSASKGAAELVVDAYRHSYFNPESLKSHGVQLATVRAGNIIGGGDWAKDRIVPDIVRALLANKPVVLRRPDANRPWQHVCDPLFGYLGLAARMLQEADAKWSTAWNLGPSVEDCLTVAELTDNFITVWGRGDWTVNDDKKMPEAKNLQLNTEKARKHLDWRCLWQPKVAVEQTATWYLNHSKNLQPLELCMNDIQEYSKLAAL